MSSQRYRLAIRGERFITCKIEVCRGAVDITPWNSAQEFQGCIPISSFAFAPEGPALAANSDHLVLVCAWCSMRRRKMRRADVIKSLIILTQSHGHLSGVTKTYTPWYDRAKI